MQNWPHSTFDKIETILVAEDRAHYKNQLVPHNTDGRRYITGETVYIVTKTWYTPKDISHRLHNRHVS